MSFPEKLKQLRLERSLTQKQLAELTGISPKTYRSYESGKTVPRVPVLKKLAVTLETSSDELIETE